MVVKATSQEESGVAPGHPRLAVASKVAHTLNVVVKIRRSDGPRASAFDQGVGVYRADKSDPVTLTRQLGAALAGLKSCQFDLKTQGSIDANALGSAVVSIEGRAVPQSTSNGWHLTSSTQLELVGDACAEWRQLGKDAIAFGFPCDALLP